MLYQPYYQPIGLVEEGIGLVVKKKFSRSARIFLVFWIATSPITSPSNLQRAGNRAGSNLKNTSPMKKNLGNPVNNVAETNDQGC